MLTLILILPFIFLIWLSSELVFILSCSLRSLWSLKLDVSFLRNRVIVASVQDPLGSEDPLSLLQ